MVDTNEFTKPVRGEVRNGVVRRRRWTSEEKGRIVAEAVTPGAVIALIARRHELTPQHLSNWIRAAKEGRIALPGEAANLGFVPVVADEASESGRLTAGAVAALEIVIGCVVVRVPKGADARTLEQVLLAVRRAVA